MELPLLVSVPLTLAFHCVEMSEKVCRKHSSLFHWTMTLSFWDFYGVLTPSPTPSLQSPSDKRDLLVRVPCPHSKDLCFTDSLKVNSSILTTSPCFHTFNINRSVLVRAFARMEYSVKMLVRGIMIMQTAMLRVGFLINGKENGWCVTGNTSKHLTLRCLRSGDRIHASPCLQFLYLFIFLTKGKPVGFFQRNG